MTGVLKFLCWLTLLDSSWFKKVLPVETSASSKDGDSKGSQEDNPQTDHDFMKEAYQLTVAEYQITPDVLSLLIPHILTQTTSPTDKPLVKRHQPKNPTPLSSWTMPDGVNLLELLHETAENLKGLTNSAGYILYLVNEETHELFLCTKSLEELHGRRYTWKIAGESTVAVYVAKERRPVVLKNFSEEYDNRFPDGQDLGDLYASNVLAYPVAGNHVCVAVVELYRTNGIAYSTQDYNTAKLLIGLASDTIVENRKMIINHNYEESNDILLTEMMRGMSEHVTEANIFTSYILHFLKVVVDSESVTYYTFENEECERKFTTQGNPVDKLDSKRKKIRFEKEKRIASVVHDSRSVVNFPDVFNDARFEKSMDRLVGLLIRSVLGDEIRTSSNSRAVVLAINKLSKNKFTTADEKIISAISKYLMISLGFQKAHLDYKWSEQLNLALAEVLKYQIQRKIPWPEKYSLYENIYLPSGFYSFDFIPQDPEYKEIVKYVYQIFQGFKVHFPNKDTLYRFVFGVKKMYRDNPYHNFKKAFLAVHFVYLLFYYHSDRFPSTTERVALLMAALLRGVDHRGLSGKYLDKIKHPIMNHPKPQPFETYHYFLGKALIDVSKILDHLKPKKLVEFHETFKECVLTCNIKVYLKSRIDVKVWLRTETLDWTNPLHRAGVRTLVMIAGDFITSVKNEKYAKKTAEKLFDELFHEGDLFRAMQIPPPLIMDRAKAEKIPRFEYSFLKNITMPCLDILRQLLPKSEILYKNSVKILAMWKDLAKNIYSNDPLVEQSSEEYL